MAPRPHILVIDDDPLFRNLIAGLLKKTHTVSVAENGSQGFHVAVDHPPHACLIDVQMPGWDGLKTVSEIRKHPALKKVPIGMLTGDASRDTVVSAVRCGADEYIVKSNFTKEELLSKLKILVDQSPLPLEDETAEPLPANESEPAAETVATAAASHASPDEGVSQDADDYWE